MFSKKYKYELEIKGMKSEDCASQVKEIISKFEKVKRINIDVSNGLATIISKKEIDEKELKKSIEKLDYSVISIKMV